MPMSPLLKTLNIVEEAEEDISKALDNPCVEVAHTESWA